MRTVKLLLVAFTLTLTASTASNYKILHTFKPRSSDAWHPDASVILVNNALYGVSSSGGTSKRGAVWKYDLTTGVESVFYSFSAASGVGPAGLMWDGTNFYGATSIGGTKNCGTVFTLDTSGKETTLYNFTGIPDGCSPAGGVAKDMQGIFYGTTLRGGDASCDCGTVYMLSAGTESVLHAFTYGPDGAKPQHTTPVLDSSGNLFGVTLFGGDTSCENGCGIVYEVSQGIYSVFHRFTGGAAGPLGLTIDGNNTLYGTLYYASNVFSLDSSGHETRTGVEFGQNPTDLTLDSSGNLYVTCFNGGSRGSGALIKVSGGTNTLLHSFRSGFDGALPYSPVIFDSTGALYGTTIYGGLLKHQKNGGVLYRLKPQSGTARATSDRDTRFPVN